MSTTHYQTQLSKYLQHQSDFQQKEADLHKPKKLAQSTSQGQSQFSQIPTQLQKGQEQEGQMNSLMNLLVFWTLFALLNPALTSPVPRTVNGYLLGTETLDQKQHQIIFKRITEYATNVEFHHVHIQIQLGELTQVANKQPHALQTGQSVSR